MPDDNVTNKPKPATSTNPKYLSRRGAFNGTGISIMQQPHLTNLTLATSPLGPKEEGNLLLIFQHHTGDIRWMARDNTGVWTGGSRYDTIARDAKNATPITLLGAGPNGLTQHHVFCESTLLPSLTMLDKEKASAN